MNNAYSILAQFYDELMDVDYMNWANYLISLFGKEVKSVLDLGCGTARLTNELHKRDYNVVAVDSSRAMLSIAWENYANSFPILNQNLIGLDLGKKFDAIISTCDVINYLIKEDDLLKAFKRIKAHLGCQGKFLFDISSKYKLENLIGENTFAEDNLDYAYIWQNQLHGNLLNMDLTFFILDADKSCYLRFEENHTQRAWHVDEILSILKKAGFSDVEVLTCFTKEKVVEVAERIQFIAY